MNEELRLAAAAAAAALSTDGVHSMGAGRYVEAATYGAGRAARALVEGAAREAGATSPKVALSPAKGAYSVSCAVGAPTSSDLTGLAARARENISKVLYTQNVSVKNVEVTVKETATHVEKYLMETWTNKQWGL